MKNLIRLLWLIFYGFLLPGATAVVVDVGLSNREKAAPSQAATGTRMKASVKRSTVKEANRFYYETFESPGASDWHPEESRGRTHAGATRIFFPR